MILRYYNEPNLNPAGNYQCGVVGGYYYLIGGPSHPCVANCFLCPQGASSMFEIQRVITGYGQIALFYGIPARVLTSQSRFGQLTMKELAAELNAGRPVLAGVSPLGSLTLPGISAHAVVFSGYDATAGPMTVTIRDPYPYELFIPFNQNPWIQAGGTYLSPGSYRVAYSQLSGPYVTWGNTAYDIR